MHSVRILKVINPIITLFYYIGFWHRGDKPTPKEFRAKLFYCVYHSLFILSLVIGAITNAKVGDTIFLTESSIAIAVVNVKLWVLIWKQNQILDLLNRICVFTVRDDEDLVFVKNKLRRFVKFAIVFCISVLVASFEMLITPLIVKENTLFMEIGFPLDYKNSEIAFWIAQIFIFTECILTSIIVCGSIMIGFLLLCCSLRYEVLGSELTKIGRISEERKGKTSEKEKHNIFFQDLKASIDEHLHTRELINELYSFFAKVFLIQLGTSGLCICGSVYCLAFDIGDNLLERCVNVIQLFYFISDLFLIAYFGNEIKLSSNRLSYNLFESDWIDQPQATKKCIIVFGEYVRQPHELLVGKLYPLTLETFTRVINSAYNMFNILKSFQQ